MANFDDTVTAVLISQPFYGELLMKYKHTPTSTIPTAAVSRTELMYNPEFWDKLTDDEGVFVLSHEIQHVVYAHLDDLYIGGESGLGPDGKRFEMDRMNRAMDYIVNDFLVVHNIGKMPSIGLHSTNFPYTMSPAAVYKQLPSDPNKDKKGPGKGAMDQHIPDQAPDGQ